METGPSTGEQTLCEVGRIPQMCVLGRGDVSTGAPGARAVEGRSETREKAALCKAGRGFRNNPPADTCPRTPSLPALRPP